MNTSGLALQVAAFHQQVTTYNNQSITERDFAARAKTISSLCLQILINHAIATLGPSKLAEKLLLIDQNKEVHPNQLQRLFEYRKILMAELKGSNQTIYGRLVCLVDYGISFLKTESLLPNAKEELVLASEAFNEKAPNLSSFWDIVQQFPKIVEECTAAANKNHEARKAETFNVMNSLYTVAVTKSDQFSHLRDSVTQQPLSLTETPVGYDSAEGFMVISPTTYDNRLKTSGFAPKDLNPVYEASLEQNRLLLLLVDYLIEIAKEKDAVEIAKNIKEVKEVMNEFTRSTELSRELENCQKFFNNQSDQSAQKNELGVVDYTSLYLQLFKSHLLDKSRNDVGLFYKQFVLSHEKRFEVNFIKQRLEAISTFLEIIKNRNWNEYTASAFEATLKRDLQTANEESIEQTWGSLEKIADKYEMFLDKHSPLTKALPTNSPILTRNRVKALQ